MKPLSLFSTSKNRWAFAALFVLAFILRVVLVLRGGQFYFPDEPHYFRSVDLVQFLAQGDTTGFIDLILTKPEHTGFLLLGMIPATIQYGLNTWLGLTPTSTVWIPSLMLALTSVASIALTAAIAQRAGATERESFIAAVLMASATSMLYFSRHLVPYDLALAFMLLALWAGLKSQPRFTWSMIFGILASIAFFCYYGYWTSIGLVLLVHTFWNKPSFRKIIARAIGAGIGFALLPMLLTAISVLRGVTPFPLAILEFSGTVSQGTFSEGWSLPWEYLWNAEHALFIVWIASAFVILAITVKRRDSILSRGLLWLGIIVTIYILLFLGSTVLEKFVVYGRLVRQMIPFFCLATACGIEYIATIWEAKKYLVWTTSILFIIQVAFNFTPPLAQQFPIDIERQVIANYGTVGRALTAKGPPVFGQDTSQTFRYVLINAQYLYPISGTRKLPDGKTILQTNHPLQFLPYQFEGLDQGEREILRPVDLSIRLIDTGEK